MPPARFDSDDPTGTGWHATLYDPVSSHVATRLDEVEGVITRADHAARDGYWVALAVAYEAAAALEPAVTPASPTAHGLPLAWARVFARGSCTEPMPEPALAAEAPRPAFEPACNGSTFGRRVLEAQALIAAGDTYQVNLTFPMHAPDAPDPEQWYATLRAAQCAPYAAYLDLGRHAVLSLSPELFFERRGARVTARPMKGTAPRGRWLSEDDGRARELVSSAKTRAENVMIVDLLRNDLGRVAIPGSVHVPALFTAERYPTLWQLTSTVAAEVPTSATLLDLFRALFPCGSVTGAPKIRTMAIINSLEGEARGLYTGTIGFLRPGGDCTFNVAIRTIVIDRETASATLGVGAGITADSVPEQEYQESLLKAAFAQGGAAPSVTNPFSLLETMRLENGRFRRRARHLARLAASARFFGRRCEVSRIDQALDETVAAHKSGTWRARLLVDPDGTPSITCEPYVADQDPWRVALAAGPVDEGDPFLCNKTTERAVYDRARRACPHVEDVLLWNHRGEITEATLGNIVADIGGIRWTPPVTSGLLAGTFRAEMLEQGVIRERTLTRTDVAHAKRIWIVNSVREWIDAVLVR
jgi:para-aminobenzoate synthetase/4-amino-4-deoxychorismate lyase